MGQTAIISPQIVDSTSIGRDLITAADQAAAQAIIGVTGVDTSADYTWTGDHTFDGSVTFTDTFDAVDGNFSGTVTTDSIDSTGSLIVSNNGTQKLEVTSSRIRPSVNFFPLNDNFVVCGQEGSRWKSMASVDGSFSGNLVSEVGGAYKLYNLGDASAVDSEYLSIFAAANEYYIRPTNAGSGAIRNIRIQSAANGVYTSRLRLTQFGAYLETNAGANLYVTNNETQVGKTLRPASNDTTALGTNSLRWANVASVDGSFSGDVEVDGAVQGGASGHAIVLSKSIVGETQIKLSPTGSTVMAFGYNGSTYTYVASNFFPSVGDSYSSGISTKRWSNTYSVDGSFSGNLVSEVGGSIRSKLNIANDSRTSRFRIHFKIISVPRQLIEFRISRRLIAKVIQLI